MVVGGQQVLVRFVAILASALASNACDDEDCGSSDVGATATAFVPRGAPVHCTDARSFEFEGRTVRLTHVEYGEEHDCPSGCFSSHICAIEDPSLGAPRLFYATWTSALEEPLGVVTECPNLRNMETWPDCTPSGLEHPVVATAAFRKFADRQMGSGPFRWCVNRYTLDGDWPD